MGGQGDPFGDVCAVPELFAEPDDPELGDPELDEPELDEPEPEVFGELFPAVPGMVPQGDPLGVVPGAAEVFGFTVEGCVALPGVGVLVEFAPGTVEGAVEPVGGAVVLPVGGAVVLPVGGAALVPVGGAECDCPAGLPAALPVALPAGADPPAGALCATTHVPQHRITERKVSFVIDIAKLPKLNFFGFLDRRPAAFDKEIDTRLSLRPTQGSTHPGYAVIFHRQSGTLQSRRSGIAPVFEGFGPLNGPWLDSYKRT